MHFNSFQCDGVFSFSRYNNLKNILFLRNTCIYNIYITRKWKIISKRTKMHFKTTSWYFCMTLMKFRKNKISMLQCHENSQIIIFLFFLIPFFFKIVTSQILLMDSAGFCPYFYKSKFIFAKKKKIKFCRTVQLKPPKKLVYLSKRYNKLSW